MRINICIILFSILFFIQFNYGECAQVYTFWRGNEGQLGDNNTTSHSKGIPYLVDSLNGINITSISAGGAHSIVLTGKNKIKKIYQFFFIFFSNFFLNIVK
jgi:alpha-tubulin suppressor-like RCC1 family protein